MKITCAFQYKLYVDETRRAALSRNAGCRRFVFNKALEIQNERKSKGEKLLTYKELAHELVLWKKTTRDRLSSRGDVPTAPAGPARSRSRHRRQLPSQ
ncbi:MAG: helix-turn-helix domain-containing protein [Sutterella wadsworthensis]